MTDYDDYDNDAADLRAEVAAERRREALRLHHWCDVCRGHTGKGSPCYEEPQEDEENA